MIVIEIIGRRGMQGYGEKRMSKKTHFNWEVFREIYNAISATEEAVIKKSFQIHIDGNSCYEDCSTPELNGLYEIFKCSWIMSQMFTGGL